MNKQINAMTLVAVACSRCADRIPPATQCCIWYEPATSLLERNVLGVYPKRHWCQTCVGAQS